MAALTPQIETAADRSARSFRSRPRNPARNQVAKNTVVMRIVDCRSAGPAARASTFRLIDAPRRTSPVLMKNSVRIANPSRERVPRPPSTAPPSRPIAIAYTGYSIDFTQGTDGNQDGTFASR